MSTTESEAIEASPKSGVSSSKRKVDVEEIEVDLKAPEPPSKRAKRALKKGKPLPPKPSSDDEKEEGEGRAKDKKEKARSEHGVWVGNLPFKLTPAELRTWLVDNSGGVITEEAITRVKLPVVKDPSRRKDEKPTNKGFAYVDFSDLGGKVAAIALSETDLSGRKLLIKDATSFEGRPAKEKEPEEENGKPAATSERSSREQRQEANASRKIFVGNMSFKTTEEDLIRNFEKCGEIEWAKLATFEDSGKCKGFGWVKFKEPEAAAWAVKGFVKIKEQIETEDDFKDADDDEESDGGAPLKEKQFKTRKWWVNRMLGRELKLELAEDDQIRYKKRYGKDAPKKEDGTSGDSRGKRDGPKGDRQGGNKSEPSKAPLKPAKDIAVARLTGAVVEHTGTKVTFD